MSSLLCLDHAGQPVYAVAEFAFDPGVSETKIVRTGGEDGWIDVPQIGKHRPRFAVVMPLTGYWNTFVDDPGSAGVCVVEEISPLHRAWWRVLIGRTEPDLSAGKGIKIGVIDLGFKPASYMGHVRCVNLDGSDISSTHPLDTSHGHRVARVCGERGDTLWTQGIAPASELICVDISCDEDTGAWDYEKIAPAIRLLVDEFGVDIINISGGAPAPATDELFEWATKGLVYEIDRARRHGALVVAAAGNDPKVQPAIPARLKYVVGVGGVGQCNISPVGSMMNKYEVAATGTISCIGQMANGINVFHHMDSTWGKGIDAVAPGIGIFMHHGEHVFEYTGTSYSAPIVCGVVACILGGDDAYDVLRGEARSNYAWKRLRDSCVDLSMSRDRQGFGLPILD
jgi:subtilisin family serine protease